MATTLNRSDSKTLKTETIRACIVCTETSGPLIRPCRCNNDYCSECLIDMFMGAVDDATRFPPRCCQLLQIHTVIAHLDNSDADRYRARSEEWIAPVKVYCPVPSCSAFIPEKRLPPNDATQPSATPPSLSSVLKEVLGAVIQSPSARFFREEAPIDQLPGYSVVIKHPMHLGMIQSKANNDEYQSSTELSNDMRLIHSNSRDYNGQTHPVTKAAGKLVNEYIFEMLKATDRLIKTLSSPPVTAVPPFFPCPKCHIAICTKCKQIEHADSPCNTSASDHEVAMLAQFGYKRCPRCRAGVKKMFGCSHMQCLCGAHWCYYCQQSLEDCTGDCEDRLMDGESSDEDSVYDSEGEEAEAVRPPVAAQGVRPQTTAPGERQSNITGNPNSNNSNNAVANRAPNSSTAVQHPKGDHAEDDKAYIESLLDGASSPAQHTSLFRPPHTARPPATQVPVNLDAGGGRRWADGTYDFGDEPEEDGFNQVWSCRHTFSTFATPPNDGFDHGDLSRMECNRCFGRVQVKKNAPGVRKRRRLGTNGARVVTASPPEDEMNVVPEGKEAHECSRCKVLVCVGCKEKYIKEQGE